MPIDVFTGLTSTAPGERNLVKSITRFPSRQNRFRDAYEPLSDADKRAINNYVNNLDNEIEQIIAEHTSEARMQHAASLMPAIDATLGSADSSLDEIDAISGKTSNCLNGIGLHGACGNDSDNNLFR